MSDLPIVLLVIAGLGLVYVGYKTVDDVSNNKDDIRELMYHRHPDFSKSITGDDTTGMPINVEGRLLHNPTLSGIRGWY